MASAATLQIDSNAANKWVAEVQKINEKVQKIMDEIAKIMKTLGETDQKARWASRSLQRPATICRNSAISSLLSAR